MSERRPPGFDPDRQGEKKEVPEKWGTAVIAYRALETLKDEIRQELGTNAFPGGVGEGKVSQEFREKIQEGFYTLIDEIKDVLSDWVLLRKGSTAQLSVGGLSLKANPSQEYFLPKTKEIYEVNPLSLGVPFDPQVYLPESQTFKGFGTIRTEMHPKVFFRGRDFRLLSEGEIETVLTAIEEKSVEPHQSRIKQLRQEVARLQKERSDLLESKLEEYGRRVKPRVVNLLRATAETLRGRIVSPIEIPGHQRISRNEELFLLPAQEQLVIVPLAKVVKKRFLRKSRDTEEPDFTHARPAQDKFWIKVAVHLPFQILKLFPKEFQHYV